MKSIIIALFVLFTLTNSTYVNEHHNCQLCEEIIETALLQGEQFALQKCQEKEICHMFDHLKYFNNGQKAAHHYCLDLGYCQEEKWQQHFLKTTPSSYDIRVTKALGTKGYNKVRVSVVSNQTLPELNNSDFDYKRQFQYRWTDKYLYSKLVDVVPGENNFINIGNQQIKVRIPKENQGTRGIIIADPCFSSEYVSCKYKDQFDTFNRLTSLFNAALKHDDTDFWAILGDNFYDRYGKLTQAFFDALTIETKSKVMYSVIGNHDYWVLGSPYLKSIYDQYGNGFMQFYAQDSVSTTLNQNELFDLSVDPDKKWFFQNRLSSPSNFFWYNRFGDLGFIAYSGAYSYEENLKYIQEACSYFNNSDARAIFLLGHWNDQSSGCTDAKSPVPNMYLEIQNIPGCDTIKDKIRYIEGHQHCNVIKLNNTGFMVGGMGMSDSDCGGYFGIPVFDTTKDNKLRVFYYPIADVTGVNNYQQVLDCFTQNGISGCEHLAVLWSEVSLVEFDKQQQNEQVQQIQQ